MTFFIKKIFFIKILIFFNFFSYSENFPTGARSTSMANASVTFCDIWALSHNQAGIAFLKHKSLAFHFENHFLLKEHSLKSIFFVYPTNMGNFGLNYYNFGYSKYNISKIGIAYAKSFSEKFSFGLQLNYFNTYIENNIKNQGVINFEFGFLMKISENLSFGSHIFRPQKSKIENYENENLSTILKFGLSYKIQKMIIFCLEAEKDIKYKQNFKFGMEYNYKNNIFLRMGIFTNPNFYSYGIGFVFKKFKTDIAFSKHPILSYSSHISVNYEF